MADYWPAANGNWSTLSNWLTATGQTAGVLPGSADDVYADTRTIYIDISPNVRSVRTTARSGGTAGGVFNINNGISLSATSVIPGTTTCVNFLSAAPNSCTIVGTISGSTTTAAAYGINNNSNGTVNIFGDVIGSAIAGNFAVNGTAAGNTINVVGNVIGSNTGPGASYCMNVGGGLTTVLNITGNIIAGTFGGGITLGVASLNIFGNIIATNGGTFGVFNQSQFNTITMYGNISGGSVDNAQGMRLGNNTPGNIFIYGNIHGGGGAGSTSGAVGIQASLTTTSTVNVVGSIFGGYAGGAQFGFTMTNSCTLNVSGNVVGGIGTNNYAINNNTAAGIVNVYGSAIGGNGTTAYGINNTSTGVLYATKAVGNGFGLGSVGIAASTPGVFNGQNGRAYIEQAEFGPRGATPISGPVYILPSNRNTLTGVLTALGNTVTFYNSLSVSGLIPLASSVRLGTVYNVGNTTGTMAVPSASAVEFGVPVDNTFGVAALTPQTVWGYSRLSATDVGSMGDRLRNAATTQSIGYQIASFNL